MGGLFFCTLVAALHTTTGRIGDFWGSNIHWTHENAEGEAAMYAKAFKVARMDMTWESIERSVGVYDFTPYDELLSTMRAHAIRPYWILDYGNSLYPPSAGSSKSCNTVSCIAAFGKFAAAAAEHFHGNDIIWETVNEPNGMGGDNATDLTALALAAAPGFAAFHETFVGPTCAGMDFPYMEKAFAAGILHAYTNVSVHPYRAGPPESVLEDWATLASLISKYSPASPKTMIDGEWGYTSAAPPCPYGNKVPSLSQGKYLARMWLTNAFAGVQVSIAYDWRDDGANLTDCESNFGSVQFSPTGNASLPYLPKPSYLAALTAQTGVGSAGKFGERVTPFSTSLRPSDVFILRFDEYSRSGGGGQPFSYALWTNATECTTAQPSGRFDCGYSGITREQCFARACCWDAGPPPPGTPQCFAGLPVPLTPVTFALPPSVPDAACFNVVNFLGQSLIPACAKGGQLTLALDDGPTYLL